MNQNPVNREKETIGMMIRLYCRRKHAFKGELCPQCGALLSYAAQRIERCVHGEDKPTCGKCTIHCYKPSMRNQVRLVMKYAGPRMIIYHPFVAIRHYLKGLRRTHRPGR